MQKLLAFLFISVYLFQQAVCSTLWNGNFNSYQKNTDLDEWSWANQNVGEYQTYIYGNKNPANKMSTFVAMSPDYKQPADTKARQGVRVEINQNSQWNGQTMLRTELIARFNQTQVETGVLFLQFSMKQGKQNPLRVQNEHQLVFFESHFCDIKYGGQGGANLWFTTSNGQRLWSTPFTADVWNNFAIQIDYSAGRVALHHSTGADPLKQVVPYTSTSTSKSDWHVGILRLPENGAQDPAPEWVYYSSVYANTAIVPLGN